MNNPLLKDHFDGCGNLYIKLTTIVFERRSPQYICI